MHLPRRPLTGDVYPASPAPLLLTLRNGFYLRQPPWGFIITTVERHLEKEKSTLALQFAAVLTEQSAKEYALNARKKQEGCHRNLRGSALLGGGWAQMS